MRCSESSDRIIGDEDRCWVHYGVDGNVAVLYKRSLTVLFPAEQLTRQRTGEFVVGNNLCSVHEGSHVALGVLHKTSAVGGEVIRHGGHVEAEMFVVDEVQVGAQAGGNEAAVGEAVHLGGFASLTLHHLFQVEAGAALAVAYPVLHLGVIEKSQLGSYLRK